MSYDPNLLFEQISVCLNENPRKTLEELAQSLHVRTDVGSEPPAAEKHATFY